MNKYSSGLGKDLAHLWVDMRFSAALILCLALSLSLKGSIAHADPLEVEKLGKTQFRIEGPSSQEKYDQTLKDLTSLFKLYEPEGATLGSGAKVQTLSNGLTQIKCEAQISPLTYKLEMIGIGNSKLRREEVVNFRNGLFVLYAVIPVVYYTASHHYQAHMVKGRKE